MARIRRINANYFLLAKNPSACICNICGGLFPEAKGTLIIRIWRIDADYFLLAKHPSAISAGDYIRKQMER